MKQLYEDECDINDNIFMCGHTNKNNKNNATSVMSLSSALLIFTKKNSGSRASNSNSSNGGTSSSAMVFVFMENVSSCYIVIIIRATKTDTNELLFLRFDVSSHFH